MNRPAQQAKSLVSRHREPDFPVAPIFVQRWSPRAFDASPMSLADLQTILEAARWAPSAFNIQPWRFVYALRDDEHWEAFLRLLDPFNEAWAHNASALVFVVSDTLTPAQGSSPAKPSRTHSFDTGAAWAHLALQASILGYQAHAMAGIFFDEVARQLSIPERYRVEIAVAIGRQASPTILAPALREREVPSNRMPLDRIAFARRCMVDPTIDGVSD
jgi:nitroreductase